MQITGLKKCINDTHGTKYCIHLNNAGSGLMQSIVLDRIKKYLDCESKYGGYEAADIHMHEISLVYKKLAELIGTSKSNIAIVENATVALSQALSSFDFKRGDTIITTNVDYSSNQIFLLSIAARFGVKIIRGDDLQEGGVDPASIDKLIKRHTPKIVVLTWIPTNSGLIQDAHAVGEICEKYGIPFVLDACQAVGQLPIDVKKLKCTFLAATGRKFLRGPRGTGFLYVSEQALLENYYPLFVDTRGAKWEANNSFRLKDGAIRFENWEFSYALVLGLGMAAEYATELDVSVTWQRSKQLGNYLRRKLTEIEGTRTLDKGNETCAIVTVSFKSVSPEKLVEKLRKFHINTSVVYHHHAVIDMNYKKIDKALRLSPHYYNTHCEIDQVVETIKSIVHP